MSGSVQSPSFQDLLDAVEALPLDDLYILVEVINKRIIEKRREEILDDFREAREAFKRGDVHMGTVSDLMRDLED
ncbi:MAG TPA: hypothetical protein VN455_04050 [Methanotrichaceae archaeon]|nr:hypothetical protein [Methanotrichaceae archaeon]